MQIKPHLWLWNWIIHKYTHTTWLHIRNIWPWTERSNYDQFHRHKDKLNITRRIQFKRTRSYLVFQPKGCVGDVTAALCFHIHRCSFQLLVPDLGQNSSTGTDKRYSTSVLISTYGAALSGTCGTCYLSRVFSGFLRS